tara:strand:- start:60 stop:653 length:594 start_codon:yes stop_codon:yes gene_type:complete
MGLFGKRKARKEAEAKAEAAQSAKWDNPTQSKKPAYKQKGFDAGEGTNRNGSGPDKKGDDKYTPPKSDTPKKREPNKVVSLETKKPKAINTDTETPTLKPRTDTEPKKKPLSLYQKDLLAKKNKTGKYAVKKSGPDHSKNTNKPYKGVTNDDKEGQAKIAKGNKRAIANRKAKGAAKSGETYTYIDSKGRETTATKP